MEEERISVREWQKQYKAGAFNNKNFDTQVKAGWYDWFCSDNGLAGRLKKLAPVIMGITEPFILDNYYLWLKNNCPLRGPLYDDVRFEPLEGERDGKYFLVSLNSPHERKKWALVTERYGFGAPEFECDHVREMTKYVNRLGHELENGINPVFIAEKEAIRIYAGCHDHSIHVDVYREGEHHFSFRSPKDRILRECFVTTSLDDIPAGFTADDPVWKYDQFYLFVREADESPKA